MRILVALEPVDGRKGIDSLVALCREKLTADPFSGCLFIFRSRRATSIRVLAYDLCGVFSNVQSFPQNGRLGPMQKRDCTFIQRFSSHSRTVSLLRQAAL